MNESYQYQRLGTAAAIRLIAVLPDRVDESIMCKIYDFPEADIPTSGYYALSYFWGDPTPTRTIHLEDRHGNTYPHALHKNLWQFLNHAWQKKSFDLLYWMDSLCLNQEDHNEIAQQVPRMGEIYSAAEEVLIWLGHDQQGEEDLRLVRDWPEPIDWSPLGSDNEEEPKRTEWAEKRFDKVKDAAEVVLARKVTVAYGKVALGLDEFLSHVNPFRDASSEFTWLPTIWSLVDLRKTGGKKPLLDLISDFELCKSSRTIDKVYGILGLVADLDDGTSPAKLIEVNYEKRPFEVYWDTAFESGAPWNKYSDILFSLGHLLWHAEDETGDFDFWTLKEYAREENTSEQHARLSSLERSH
ncbi:hypothetical protein AYO22_06939 [Fonsecaea multimorphosa]|nr:hypothetical protein AYO22_06939 [Fonsecaea multimorphosa]